MNFYKVILLTILLFPAISSARPVSYPGGWTVMQKNHDQEHSLHVHYSPTKDYSIGYMGEYWDDEDVQLHSAKVNYLLNRWNGKASQGNIYLTAGAGIAITNENGYDSNTEELAYTGLMADWENRRYFVSYENELIHAGDSISEFRQNGRVGIAPYIGDYGDLHTWLMLQVDHKPEDKDNFTFTPLVRFFYDVSMVEIGLNEDGDGMLHFIHRF